MGIEAPAEVKYEIIHAAVSPLCVRWQAYPALDITTGFPRNPIGKSARNGIVTTSISYWQHFDVEVIRREPDPFI